ncbi:hypothetical protein FPQ18DRAFT_389823 [Pyronema domesticum]|nr:hypothetical protein FPQ18DRAFT_389823 [Pyronema domesticum]
MSTITPLPKEGLNINAATQPGQPNVEPTPAEPTPVELAPASEPAEVVASPPVIATAQSASHTPDSRDQPAIILIEAESSSVASSARATYHTGDTTPPTSTTPRNICSRVQRFLFVRRGGGISYAAVICIFVGFFLLSFICMYLFVLLYKLTTEKKSAAEAQAHIFRGWCRNLTGDSSYNGWKMSCLYM